MKLLLALLLTCQTTWIRLNKETLSVELAKTDQEHYKGLMGRTELSDREGMLFVYKQPHILSFWMKGTKIPLSIGFFDENQVLLTIQEMFLLRRSERYPEVYRSFQPALYALEMPTGWFERHGIKPGTRFEWIDENK
jgi:uncharacterized membrane protein (UPF0127 family)